MSQTRYCPRCLTTFTEDLESCSNLACGRPRPPGGWGVVLHAGDILDRHYEVSRALAVAGMGITYRARELDAEGVPVGPDLAVKVLYAQRDQGSFLKRLATEAQILQELAHPHIVECRGFVQRTGQPPYLVTLFEHGGNLGEHLERCGPFSPQVAGGMLRQILMALDVAHRRGIVHRDLKPENVLLRSTTPADQVPHLRVADFGIAKVQAFGDRATRHGSFVGTPEFAAPEQFLLRHPTPSTDVYAAGAVFWALLTGTDVVRFENRHDIERCHEEVLAHLPPRLPAPLAESAEGKLAQALLDAMMQVDPSQRLGIPALLPAMEQLERGESGRALRTLDEGRAASRSVTLDLPADPEDDEPPPKTGKGPSAWWWALPAIALLLGTPCAISSVLVVAAATGHLRGPPGEADARSLPPLQIPRLTTIPPARDLSTSPDAADRDEGDRLRRLLAETASDLGVRCGFTAPIVADVRLDAKGQVRDVRVTGALDDGQRWCVQRSFRQIRTVRTSAGEVSLRVSLSFN